MRTCKKCGLSLPLGKFHKNKRCTEGRTSTCGKCIVTRVTEWQIRTGRRTGIRKNKNPYSSEFRREYLDRLRDIPCADCVGRFPTVAMDFDHLPGCVKSFGIMQGWRHRKWEDILAEIAKCEIVCSNCHRVRTAERRC